MMLTVGQEILKGLKETRKFHGQIGLIMRTAEEVLGEKGWTNAIKNNSRKTCEITSDLYQSAKWMPSSISRFYKNEEVNDVLIYIGILLDLETDWQGFEEPWLTTGLFEFIPNSNFMDKIRLEWVKAHLDDEHDPDGTFVQYKWDQEDIDSGDSEDEIYRSTMALPLIEMKNVDDLRMKVIEPLIKEVEFVIKPS